MPSRTFPLRRDEPPRVEIRWRGMWNDIHVSFDGKEVGTIANQAALKTGQLFTLPDGSQLKVRLEQSFASAGLLVERNGKPLPGSHTDPMTQARAGSTIVLFVGGLSVVIGLVAEVFQVPWLQSLGAGWASVGLGLAFGVLGFFAWRMHTWALVVAVVLYGLELVASVWFMMEANGKPSIGGLVFKGLMLMGMVRGIAPMRRYNARKDDTSVADQF